MASWFDSLSISASGLSAQRLRMDVISNNIANADTTRTAQGGPYRREMVELQSAAPSFQDALASAMQGSSGASTAGGVEVGGVVQDTSPYKVVYDPSNPDAVNGYVQMPNVDMTTEMTDMLEASRSYEANVTAFDAGKQMVTDALNLGK